MVVVWYPRALWWIPLPSDFSLSLAVSTRGTGAARSSRDHGLDASSPKIALGESYISQKNLAHRRKHPLICNGYRKLEKTSYTSPVMKGIDNNYIEKNKKEWKPSCKPEVLTIKNKYDIRKAYGKGVSKKYIITEYKENGFEMSKNKLEDILNEMSESKINAYIDNY